VLRLQGGLGPALCLPVRGRNRPGSAGGAASLKDADPHVRSPRCV